MRVCVFGAGAVGCNLAANLVVAGTAEISVVARGPTLKAIRSRGIVLQSSERRITACPDAATDDPASLPPQDAVIVTLKAPALPGAAAPLAALLAPDAPVLFATNGIPWWWWHGLDRTHGSLPLLDPEASLWNRLGPERALGAVIYSANEAVEPGLVVHRGSNSWMLGEPDGRKTGRLEAMAELLSSAGLKVATTSDLRHHVWLKLARNVSRSPLCALTRLDNRSVSGDPALARVMTSLITETIAVAQAMGSDIAAEIDVPAAVDPVQFAPGQCPSMLHDILHGRPMEVEAMLGQLQAFAQETGTPVPTTELLLPLLRGLQASLARR